MPASRLENSQEGLPLQKVQIVSSTQLNHIEFLLKNIANKTEVKTGIRVNKNIEIISGLIEGDIIVAEGLKKVRPQGKIKPINK